MEQPNDDQRELSAAVNQTCLPLFIGKKWGLDGRPPTNFSATCTLVRFEGRIYVVTCDHVREEAYSEPHLTASISAGRLVIELQSWDKDGKQVPALRKVNIGGAAGDVSIGEIAAYQLEFLSKTKTKKPIDLDDFHKPDWLSIQDCLAAGYPSRMKRIGDQPDVLESPMVEVIAALQSVPRDGDDLFALQSALEKPPAYSLSGISGGPIFGLSSDRIAQPIGIVFEGHPSGEDVGASSSQSFLTENDILIRGLHLSPTIFKRWLDARI